MTVFEYGTTYPKIILAGEYSILMGGMALTIPLRDFYARLEFLDDAADFEAARESNIRLALFLKYLEEDASFRDSIDLNSLKSDLSDGLYLWSNIPYGCGLGSSGVVCATLYKTYRKQRKVLAGTGEDYLWLRKMFAAMESFYHGQSSGLDPLACYINRPLLVTANEVQVQSKLSFGEGHWFLLDTGLSRNTGHLVNKFLEYTKNHLYRQELEYHYLPVVNEFITRILHSNSDDLNDWASTRPLKTLMEMISTLQMRYFREMIPDGTVSVWQQGITSGTYYLKLLGAGGGGYFLGFTLYPEITMRMIVAENHQITWVNLT